MRNTSGYKNLSLEESLASLETLKGAPSEQETAKRLELFEHNEITEKKKKPLF